MLDVSNRSIIFASIIVFAIAIVLRVPSCYESFWVDELHSAWCVWDGIADVAPRADIGNQSPFYFLGLWFWKQLFGGSELALRISSVLAVAASCLLLTIAVGKSTGSLTAGITAGLVLAIENNSIFYGTELRPFAFVILFASVATICFARLASSESRHDQRTAWVGLMVAILLAGLCQPTSLGVLIWMPATLVCLWIFRNQQQLFRCTLTDGLLGLTTTAVGFALWSMTLNESWDQRQAWAAFASATSIGQLWHAWDWTWLWCLPATVLLAAMWFGRRDGFLRSMTAIWMLAWIAVVGTLGYWLVAWYEWLPLWHRRYFISALPTLAVVGGGAVAAVEGLKLRKLSVVVAILLVGGLLIRQELHRSLPSYPVALISRGEDWRGAIDWVRGHAKRHDRVYIESGLVESRRWLRSIGGGIDDPTRTPDLRSIQQDYLCYVALGPYALAQSVEPIATDLEIPLRVLNDDARQIFLIVRRPTDQIPINPTKWGTVYGNRYIGDVRSFGNVTVISMPTLESNLRN